MLNLREMSHTFKQVFQLCPFLPFFFSFFHNETDGKLVLYVVWDKRKSFNRQSSAPLKDDK